MTAALSILDVRDGLCPNVFEGDAGKAWRAFLAALFALPLDAEALDVYRRCTGRGLAPSTPAREAWVIVGRRGGKSLAAAFVAVFCACFRTYRLAPGERGVFMVLAADRRQARVVKRYISGLLDSVPMLAGLVVKETKEAIELGNGITIEIHTASFRAVRGYTVVGAICDEAAFWAVDDSANPDAEILAALRPAMATVPGAVLLVISSPYSRRGELWKAYREHYGKDGDDVLVWKADTRTMNPTVPEAVIAAALAEDEPRARAEYLAEFRTDVETFISREALDAVTAVGVREVPRVAGVYYRAFVDPSGGSADSMTLAIAHREGETAALDVIREIRPPFSPEAAVAELAELLGKYGVTEVTGDRYGGEWPREQFRKQGIDYRLSDASKGVIYADILPAINSGRVVLLDNPRLLAQAATLERRTGRGGRDLIDHAPGAHDDVINAAAGALRLVAEVRPEPRISIIDLDD